MNNYIYIFLILYAISFLVSVYCLSKGDAMLPRKTYREHGMIQFIGLMIGLPLFLAAVGIL